MSMLKKFDGSPQAKGMPNAFLTLSCAEYHWIDLLNQIVETVERRNVSRDYVQNLSTKDKNRLISDNVVQTTLHFQKRIDKLFTLMKNDFFKGRNNTYHVTCYYYRVEFQQRGAPHIHSLVWLNNQDGVEAPNFWVDSSVEENVEINSIEMQTKFKEIEEFTDQLISTSPTDIRCDSHEYPNEEDVIDC